MVFNMNAYEYVRERLAEAQIGENVGKAIRRAMDDNPSSWFTVAPTVTPGLEISDS